VQRVGSTLNYFTASFVSKLVVNMQRQGPGNVEVKVRFINGDSMSAVYNKNSTVWHVKEGIAKIAAEMARVGFAPTRFVSLCLGSSVLDDTMKIASFSANPLVVDCTVARKSFATCFGTTGFNPCAGSLYLDPSTHPQLWRQKADRSIQEFFDIVLHDPSIFKLTVKCMTDSQGRILMNRISDISAESWMTRRIGLSVLDISQNRFSPDFLCGALSHGLEHGKCLAEVYLFHTACMSPGIDLYLAARRQELKDTSHEILLVW
jgi:hypothetical protein